MRRILRVIIILAASLLTWSLAGVPGLASVGVGVDLGKIELTDSLIPGSVYHLPTIGVINTGNEVADYQVEVSYMDDQAEIKPASAWFSFEPGKFTLESGTSRRVSTTLRIPMDAKVGNYFALIKAYPAAKQNGAAAIGVAAATKLSFSIKETNFAVAIGHRVADFFRDSSPFAYIGLAAVAVIILILVFRRFFRFSIKLTKKLNHDANR